MGERIKIADVKVDVENAFDLAKNYLRTDAAYGDLGYMPAAKQSKVLADARNATDDAEARVAAFLAQCEAEREQLAEALTACREARHALSSLNGEVSFETWKRLYPVTQKLNAALAALRD